jgi:EmrB/QacA subfamily drug resistance transporter
MFVLGLEIFTVASLLCALAPSTELLIAFRVLQALGAAFLVPSSLALVLNAFPPDRRSHGVALLSAVAAGAAGLGPSLGGALVAVANWRLVFLVNLPIGAAAIVLARRRLVESRTPGRRRMPDVAGSGLFALATAALVLGVVKGRDWGWASLPVIASFVVAVALGALVLRRTRTHSAPVIDLALLRIRTFSVTNAMTVVAAAGFYGYTLTNVLFLTGVWRYTVLQAGLALTPGPFVAAAVAGPTSRLVQRIGPRPVLVAGGLIWGGAVLWFVERVGIAPDFLGVWLPGIVMLGIGAGTLLPNLSGAAVASAPGESYATATGLNSVARQVGAALGVALVVAILGTPSPLDVLNAFHHAWTFGAACLFAAGAGCLLVQRLRPESSPSLSDAARVVMRTTSFAAVAAPARPRARRAVHVETPAPVARRQSTADFLTQVPLFAGLEPELRAGLASHVADARLPAGEWLFRESDPGDAMYVVRAGRLEVVDERTGSVIRELGRGDVLGELALLTGSPRSASVRAARTSDVLVVRRSDFEGLLEGSPGLSLALNRVLAEQLRDTRAPAPTARPRPATIAVIGLDARVPALEIADGLAAALAAYTSCALLTGREAAAPASGTAAVYGPLLDAAESANDLVVIAAGSVLEAGPWTEYSLQQADRILAVTAGGAIPEAVASLPELRGCDLVGYGASPGALAGWAAQLEPIESHVLAPATLAGDLERTARRLTGRSIGIVLSGGGARAFAHVGVLEELVDSGLAIERVVGVSMGAYVGALFALGLDGDAMTARCFEEWVHRRPLADYTVPAMP